MQKATLLYDYFDESVKKYPDKEALIFGEERFTYSELFKRVNILSDYFYKTGIQRLDRVLVYSDNSPEVIISLYAAIRAGGVFTIINNAVQLQKFTYILNDCKPAIIVSNHSRRDIVETAIKNTGLNPVIIWTGEEEHNLTLKQNVESIHWDDIFTEEILTREYLEPGRISGNRVLDIDLAGLIYTSGSTGEPKGVMESHHNIISAARSIIQYLDNKPEDIVLNTLPLSFDYGLYQVIMAFMYGGTIILEKSFIFLSRVLTLIAKEKVTGFPIVPTIVAMIFKTLDLRNFDLRTLRYISNTGAVLPVEHIKRLRHIMPHVQIYSMFGLTECKRISYLPPDKIDIKPDSVGIPMPNCEVFVVDENEKPVIAGETGELVVRGSNVMQGYWNDPEQTARTFRYGLGFNEKLLFTGDYFKRDADGFLYFLGRKDDMIKSRGERISAREIERIITQMEEVNECAVIGVDDELLGQAIKAFVVLFPGKDVDKRIILSYCAANMEPYSVPKYIEFISELPKTPHGKIDKKILKKISVKKL